MIEELNDQLEELGTSVTATVSNGVIVFRIGGDLVSFDVHRRVAVTPATALRLIAEQQRPGFVVGDIVHAQAVEYFVRHGWSFWDRRGRLRVWLPDLDFRLDMNGLRSFVTGGSGPDRVNPVVGAGSIAVALALLTADDPNEIGVRTIARAAGMNASTISRARSKLIDAALIDQDGSPLPNELFWATSRAWHPETVAVDLEPSGDDWVLGGDSAAARHGAAVFDENGRWYTTSRDALQRWSLRHRSEGGDHEISLAPSPLVVATATDAVVHPVVAALDLSTTSRGREILMSWTTPPIGKPVWT